MNILQILKRIFSFLKCADVKNCGRVCQDWGVTVDTLADLKYNDFKLATFDISLTILIDNIIIPISIKQYKFYIVNTNTLFLLSLTKIDNK